MSEKATVVGDSANPFLAMLGAKARRWTSGWRLEHGSISAVSWLSNYRLLRIHMNRRRSVVVGRLVMVWDGWSRGVEPRSRLARELVVHSLYIVHCADRHRSMCKSSDRLNLCPARQSRSREEMPDLQRLDLVRSQHLPKRVLSPSEQAATRHQRAIQDMAESPPLWEIGTSRPDVALIPAKGRSHWLPFASLPMELPQFPKPPAPRGPLMQKVPIGVGRRMRLTDALATEMRGPI